MARQFITERKARVVDLETGDVITDLPGGRSGWVTVTDVTSHPSTVGLAVVTWCTPLRYSGDRGQAQGWTTCKGFDLVTVQVVCASTDEVQA